MLAPERGRPTPAPQGVGALHQRGVGPEPDRTGPEPNRGLSCPLLMLLRFMFAKRIRPCSSVNTLVSFLSRGPHKSIVMSSGDPELHMMVLLSDDFVGLSRPIPRFLSLFGFDGNDIIALPGSRNHYEFEPIEMEFRRRSGLVPDWIQRILERSPLVVQYVALVVTGRDCVGMAKYAVKYTTGKPVPLWVRTPSQLFNHLQRRGYETRTERL